MTQGEKKHMEKYRKLAIFFGIFLSVISAVFTCQLLLRFADTGLSKLIFVCMGIAVQCVQTLTITLAAYCVFQGKPARAIPSACIYLLLLILSFAGTIGSLSSENREINDLAKQNSPEYRICQDQLNDLDTQIAYVRKLIDDCSARSIISRCVTPKTAELNDLLAEKKRIQEHMVSMKPQYSGDELFRRIGDFLGIDPDQAKSLIYLLYSFALDLGAACLLAYSAGLLAFRERDIWAAARAESEAEKRRLALEREKLLAGLPSDTQHKTAERPDNTHPVPYSTVRYGTVPVQAGRTDTGPSVPDGTPGSLPDAPEKTGTQAEPDKHRIGYIPDRDTQKTARTDTSSTADKVQRYISALFGSQKPDGSLTGRRKIGDLLGMSQAECDRIHTRLKRAGLIRVEGMKTFPECGMAEMLQRTGGMTG